MEWKLKEKCHIKFKKDGGSRIRTTNIVIVGTRSWSMVEKEFVVKVVRIDPVVSVSRKKVFLMIWVTFLVRAFELLVDLKTHHIDI